MNNCELKLLAEAAADRKHLTETTGVYLKLRNLLNEPSSDAESEFRELFSKYYGINAAGLTNEWKDKYFQLLFSFKQEMPDEPHRIALRELFALQRLKRDNALQFSFVSKLVAIHDERQPLFDRYVQSYFGLGPPSLTALTEFRISGFLQNLDEIRRRYESWLAYEPFAEILRNLRRESPGLANCHSVRICDFLVWSVGKKYWKVNTREPAEGHTPSS